MLRTKGLLLGLLLCAACGGESEGPDPVGLPSPTPGIQLTLKPQDVEALHFDPEHSELNFVSGVGAKVDGLWQSWSLTVTDLNGGVRRTVPLTGPNRINRTFLLPKAGKLVTTEFLNGYPGRGSLWLLETATGQGPALPYRPEVVLVDPNTNRIFVAEGGRIAILDGASGQLYKQVPWSRDEGPFHVGVNRMSLGPDGTLYSVHGTRWFSHRSPEYQQVAEELGNPGQKVEQVWGIDQTRNRLYLTRRRGQFLEQEPILVHDGTGRQPETELDGVSTYLNLVDFQHDSLLLVIGDNRGALTVYDVRTCFSMTRLPTAAVSSASSGVST